LAYSEPAFDVQVKEKKHQGDVDIHGGKFMLGSDPSKEFVFDNEKWAHEVELAPFRIARLRGMGFSVLAIDYRGFGKSDGDLPSEASVYEDARVGWRWVVAHAPDAAHRFIYGHSLGGAVAVDLAAGLPGGSDGARMARRTSAVEP